MNMDESNVAYVESIIMNESQHEDQSEGTCHMNAECNISQSSDHEQPLDNSEKHSAVWTTDATSLLLKLYEEKLEMLETPKKKTRIWIAISDNLKDFNVEMSPDQVRWKINALTKKYKQCIDSGQHDRFKYFKEMDSIYAHYNIDCDAIEPFQSNRELGNKHMRSINTTATITPYPESRSIIEMRKIRLAHRIECDRSQTKINLEKQWLDYLKLQEEQKLLRDKVYERRLKLREQILDLRKKDIEFKESLELRKIEIKEKQQLEFLQLEREKYELLKQLFTSGKKQ